MADEKTKRLRNVTKMTPRGEINITFRPVIIDENESEERKNRLVTGYVCTEDCSYRQICPHLYDPRTEDKSGKFVNFCNDLVSEDTSLAEMVPVEGTLENNIEGIEDIYKQVLGENPLIKLDTIIDKLCPGMCSMYCKDHSMCRRDGNNYSCLLNSLFEAKRKEEADNNGE